MATAAPKTSTKPTTSPATASDDQTVSIDRRRDERRGDADVQAKETAGEPRRKTQRRRHIDPTTCERDYSGKEVEFMKAMDDYKQSSGRMFPTCSEVLEVIRSLGYVQLTDEQYDSLGLVDEDLEESESYSEEEADELVEA